MTREEDITLLKAMGLTEYEAIAYLTLVNNPKLTAVELSQKSSIPLQRVYDTLDSLIAKGFTTANPSRPKVFEAQPPSEAWKRYIEFKRWAFDQEQRQLREFSVDLVEGLEMFYWQTRMRMRVEELLKPIPSLEAAEEETVKLIEQAHDKIRILTAILGWLPRVETSLKMSLQRGVGCDVLFSATGVEKRDILRKLVQMGCRVKLSYKPWFPLRETIVDGEKVLFVIWSSKYKNTFWKPIVFRPHLSQHPALVKVFTDSFIALWRRSEEVSLR